MSLSLAVYILLYLSTDSTFEQCSLYCCSKCLWFQTILLLWKLEVISVPQFAAHLELPDSLQIQCNITIRHLPAAGRPFECVVETSNPRLWPHWLLWAWWGFVIQTPSAFFNKAKMTAMELSPGWLCSAASPLLYIEEKYWTEQTQTELKWSASVLSILFL